MRLFIAVCCCLMLAACSPQAKREELIKPGAVSLRADREGLEKLIRLPVQPVKVTWVHAPLGAPGGRGPADFQLGAVLDFMPEAFAAMRAQLGPERGRKTLQLPGLGRVSGVAYDAAVFAKTPLLHGQCAIPDGSANRLVLYLHTT